MEKSEDLSTNDWKKAQSAVFKEYEDFIKRVQENGVDYAIQHARRLINYQKLVTEWQHKTNILMDDLSNNTVALSVFKDIEKGNESHVLSRAYEIMKKWPEFNPEPLTIWLELIEDSDDE